MKLFRSRKKQVNDQLPEEVRTFTAEEQRERMGIAWMVGIISLLIVLLITIGLFFGGRWAYNKISNKDSKSSTSSTKTTKPSKEDKNQTEEKEEAKKPQETTPTPTPVTPPTQTNPTPVVPPTNPNLPRTGPESDE